MNSITRNNNIEDDKNVKKRFGSYTTMPVNDSGTIVAFSGNNDGSGSIQVNQPILLQC